MSFLRFVSLFVLLAAPALAEIYYVGQQSGSFVRKLQPHRTLFKFEKMTRDAVAVLDKVSSMVGDTDTDTLVETDTDVNTDVNTETDTIADLPSSTASASASVSATPSVSPSATASMSTSTSTTASTSASVSASVSPSATSSITRSRTASRSFSSSPSPSNSPVNPGSVNECATTNGGCSAFATCRDLGNTVSCKCFARYDGNGQTCTKQPTCGGSVRTPGTAADCAPTTWRDGLAQYNNINADDIVVDCSEVNSKQSSIQYTFTIFVSQADGSTASVAQIASAMADVAALVEAVNVVLAQQGYPTIDPSQVTVVVNPTPSASPSPSPLVLKASDSKKKGLSDGEIAAAVICSVVGAAALLAGVVFIQMKSRKQSITATDPSKPTKYDAVEDRRM